MFLNGFYTLLFLFVVLCLNQTLSFPRAILTKKQDIVGTDHREQIVNIRPCSKDEIRLLTSQIKLVSPKHSPLFM